MNPIDNSPVRVINVIDSCKTFGQLEAAAKYAKLWARQNADILSRDKGVITSLLQGKLDRKQNLLKFGGLSL
jgi:hypothetical protein